MTTKIEWTDETINPIVGCSRVPGSPGCQNCYAATAAKSARLQQFPQYQKVGKWNGIVEFVPSQLEKLLKLKKGKRIFLCSMADMFHQNVESDWLDAIWDVMERTPQHTYQILTKRPERMLERLKGTKPLPNVWLGVSVENQKAANERIPLLLRTPATVRFLSCEPLLEDVDLTPYLPGLDWVIVGGESGHRSRGCNIDWLENITQQCLTANVPIFVKQMGANPIGLETKLTDKKGGILEEFPESLQFRQMPSKK